MRQMVEIPDSDLDAAILKAHDLNDGESLVALYQRAARVKHESGDDEAYWFLLTHAYVFALECGHCDSHRLRATLMAAGREA